MLRSGPLAAAGTQHAEQTVQVLAHERPAVTRRDAEGLELGQRHATTDTPQHPPAGQRVQGGEALRHPQWIVQGQRYDAESEADAPGLPGHGCQHHVGRGTVRVVPQQVMLGKPEGVKSEPVRNAGHRNRILEHLPASRAGGGR